MINVRLVCEEKIWNANVSVFDELCKSVNKENVIR